MKIKLYSDEQLSFFPVYAHTADIDYVQPKVTRTYGYEHHQIFLVEKGQAAVSIKNNSILLSENDMFYIGPDVPHEYYGVPDDFTTSFLSFSGKGMCDIKKYYGLYDFGIYQGKNKNKVKNAMKKVFDSLDAAHEVSTICAHTFSSIITFFDETCKKEYSPIENIYNFLEINYSKPISLDELLEIYPYSKAKLCRDFKEKYYMTVFEALISIRLKNAQRIINTNPHMKLQNISILCGFSDVSYFCKMYKRFFGNTPKST